MEPAQKSKDNEIKYWILLAFSKYSNKKFVNLTELFFEEKPDFIRLDLTSFFQFLNYLEKEGYIEKNKKSLTPSYALTRKAEKELRETTTLESDEYKKVVKCFPEIYFKDRIETIEGFIFSTGILIATYLTLTNYQIPNTWILNSLIGILLLSFGMMGGYFISISNLCVEKYKINLILKISDFIEENKHWFGYGIVIVFTILGVFILKGLQFTTNQIIGGLILEGIFLLLINVKKINQRIQSIKLFKQNQGSP